MEPYIETENSDLDFYDVSQDHGYVPKSEIEVTTIGDWPDRKFIKW